MVSNWIASALLGAKEGLWAEGGRPERVSARPSAGWGRRRRRLEAPATFPRRVTLRSGWATALLFPTPSSASVRFAEPGTRLAVWGSRLSGAPSWNPGLPGGWNLAGGRGLAGEREDSPCEAVLGGRRGMGLQGPSPPLNSGKTAIAEVGRTRRPFFPEWVEMFDAYSPSTLKTQA